MAASKQGQKSDTLNIESYIRVRPLAPNEKKSTSLELGRTEVVIKSSSDSQKSSKTFIFDRVFGEESKQVVLYSTIIQPMIREVIQGYNCTVFAYGQTGTGKTYTMSGPPDDSLSWKENIHAGIIPRALEDVFAQLADQAEEYKVSISFIELYNEKLRSLLNDSDEDTNIRLIDDLEGGVILKELSPTVVQSRDEAFQLLQKGAEKRKVATTLMNVNSSRSHTIFTIYINVKENVLDKDIVLRLGKFHLVDLAGSENVSKSGASEKVNISAKGVNKRLAEASNINKSLLTLGRVITSLTENNPHIPYRESKLTRLLRDSLGGKTKTCIIGTISPSQTSMDETESTLNYASKARSIKNKPEKNQTITKKDFMEVVYERISKLKRDLEAVQHGDGVYITKETHEEMTAKIKQLDLEVRNWYERYNTLNASFENQKENYSILKDDYGDKCAENEELIKLFQAESDKLKEDISKKKEELIVHEFLINEYKKTEKNLSEQAKQYKSVLENLLEQNGLLHEKICRKVQNENTNVEDLDKFKEDFVTKEEDLANCLDGFYSNEKDFFNNIRDSAGDFLDELIDQESALKKHIADNKERAQRNITKLVDCKEDLISKLEEIISEEIVVMEDISNEINKTNKISLLFQEEAERLYNEENELLEVTSSVAKHLGSIVQMSTLSKDFFQARLMCKELAASTLAEINEVNSSLELASNLASESAELNSVAVMKAQKLVDGFADFQSALSKSYADSTASQDKINSVHEECSSIPENVERLMNVKESLNYNINDRLCEIKSSLAREEKENEKLETKLRDTLLELNKSNKTKVDGLQNICTSVKNENNLHMSKNKLYLDEIRSLGENLDMEAGVVSRDRDEIFKKFEEVLDMTVGNVDVELRKQSNCVMEHSQSVDQFKELASNKLCNLKQTVQGMEYLLHQSEGTTPEPLNMSDLDWPTHPDPLDLNEALIEQLIQEQKECEKTPSELNLQPSTSQSSLASSDVLVPISNSHLNTVTMSPKRCESLPNLQSIANTSEKDKENFCRPDIPKISTKIKKAAKKNIKKSGLPKQIKF